MKRARAFAIAAMGVGAVLCGSFAAPLAARAQDTPGGGALAAPAATLMPVPVVVDPFEDPAAWKAVPADGVKLTVAPDTGVHGRSLRLDFDFQGGGGYAVVHRAVALELPANYRFTFRVRGACKPNNLEFKLIDASGDNVWWCNTRDFEFPPGWTVQTVRKRNLSFAWGPLGGGEPHHVAAIEFAVTAGQGGKGSVWLDDLELQPLPPPDTTAHAIEARASSELAGRPARFAVDSSTATSWASDPADPAPFLALDLGAEREFGGLVLDWVPGQNGPDYAIDLSSDRSVWRTARTVHGSNGGRDALFMPESEARFIRLRVTRRPGKGSVALAGLRVMPLAWSASLNTFFSALAHDAPRGRYPRALLGEMTYWTVTGQDFDAADVLLDEDGRLETGKGAFALEPFLYADGQLITWADVTKSQSLSGGSLPVPSVEWRAHGLSLMITAFGSGEPGHSSAFARYRVRNTGPRARRLTLDLALRPFQVNPPAQFLNAPGGVATLASLAREGRVVRANGAHGIVSLTPPTGFGALPYDAGDVVDYLAEGRLPPAGSVVDSFGHASGALVYALSLAPGEEREVDLLIPLHEAPAEPAIAADPGAARRFAAEAQAVTEAGWRERLGRVTITLPDSAMDLVRTLKAQLGYVLVNRAGPAFQPGTRAYARSWIRDGCLTSSALLRMGETRAVREFVEWFAPHQYPNGKAPCCVDARGSDPVPEHDSSGELIYVIAEYVRYTGDRAFAETLWPHVRAAVSYLDSLRQTRRTPEFRTAGNLRFFGLLPPSISHEGYSAKAMHSYWDDLFALRGFKDAAWLAALLGKPEAGPYGLIREEFARDLAASYRATMADRHIDWLAGCADLGDFDATSTSIALDPVNAEDAVPDTALRVTFERYWQFFRRREQGTEKWEAFTPYEWRNVGAFVRLGRRDRAQEALRWLMQYRRPRGWNHWAEVVWHDERTAKFIGDMPHTWVGTDFARSVLDMFAYERERDSSLVVAAGVPNDWLVKSGVAVRGLHTRWGTLSYSLRREPRSNVVLCEIADTGLRVPPGGITLVAPPGLKPASVVVRRLPARVAFSRSGNGAPPGI